METSSMYTYIQRAFMPYMPWLGCNSLDIFFFVLFKFCEASHWTSDSEATKFQLLFISARFSMFNGWFRKKLKLFYILQNEMQWCSLKWKTKNKNHMQNNDNESKVVQTWHGKYFIQFNTNGKSEWNILSFENWILNHISNIDISMLEKAIRQLSQWMAINKCPFLSIGNFGWSVHLFVIICNIKRKYCREAVVGITTFIF